MNYKRIIVPFLSSQKIREQADLFRKKFWGNNIPVEIEDIVELKLKLDIVPIKELLGLCDTDALITSNWNSIYVDYDRYLDNRYKNRLRFSLAHEIGHFVLHKNIYASFEIDNFTEFYKLIEQIPQEQYSYLELQANKFASHLLVPRDKLLLEKNKTMKAKKQYDLNKIDIKTLNSYLAISISKKFSVSEEVIEWALTDIE